MHNPHDIQGKTFNGEPVVGLQQNLSLSRRVQLAVLAHIRHNHTRYDELLKETSWATARKATEQLCLDYLVKWRGDDESGRDQLDEILREVVVLSDDESDDGEDSAAETESTSSDDVVIQEVRPVVPVGISGAAIAAPQADSSRHAESSSLQKKAKKKQVTAANAGKSKNALAREKRNFRRYQAAWDRAVDRHRAAQGEQMARFRSSPTGEADQYGSASEPMGPYTVFASPQDNHTRPSHHGSALQRASGYGFVETRPHPNGASAVARPQSPHYIPADNNRVFGKVNGAGHPPVPHNSARPVHSHLSRGPNGQIQDMLHPSIEPVSPVGPHYRPSQQRRPPAVHDVWSGTSLQPLDFSCRDGVVDRGHSRPMSIDQGPAYVDVVPNSRTYESAGYDRHASPTVRVARHYPPPVYRIPAMPPQAGSRPGPPRENLVHRGAPVIPYPDAVSTHSNHVFENRGVRSRPGMRDPYDDSDLVNRRYVGHEASLHPAPRAQAALPAGTMSKGFVTLREEIPAPVQHDPNPLSAEPFIRIRENTPVWCNPMPHHASHLDMPPPDRAGLSHAPRRVRTPDQRVRAQHPRPLSVPIEQGRREPFAYGGEDPRRHPPRAVYEEP